MTRDEVQQVAKECGICVGIAATGHWPDSLERFAAAMYAKGAEYMRERAAKICETYTDPTRPASCSGYAFWHAKPIRALPITTNTEGGGMKTVIETDDWKLGCFMDWRPKSHAEECPCCHGKKEIGGGFKDLDGPRQCPECFGMGHITKGPRTTQPDLPADLVEHMRRAWWDYMHTNTEGEQ